MSHSHRVGLLLYRSARRNPVSQDSTQELRKTNTWDKERPMKKIEASFAETKYIYTSPRPGTVIPWFGDQRNVFFGHSYNVALRLHWDYSVIRRSIKIPVSQFRSQKSRHTNAINPMSRVDFLSGSTIDLL